MRTRDTDTGLKRVVGVDARGTAPGTGVRWSAVTKRYAGGVTALNQATVVAPARAVTVVAGPKGSSKTTLLRVGAGQLPVDGGTVEAPLADAPPGTHAYRKSVTFLSRDIALDDAMTGREHVQFFGALHGLSRSVSAERAVALVSQFGLDHHIDRRVAEYGEALKRRLHVALSMLSRPRILLLDEPTAGLDPETRRALWSAIGAYAGEGNAVVTATHDWAAAWRFAAHVVFLDHGTQVASGAPRALVAQHGTARLNVRLHAPVRHPEMLRRLLDAQSGVHRVREGTYAWQIVYTGDRTDDTAVLKNFARCGVAIHGFDHTRPDLESAYLNLTESEGGMEIPW